MIKINKQLQRPDGGTVSSGSIIDYNSRFIGKGMIISFDLMHHFSESALEDGKPLIPEIKNFAYRLNKECTEEEWAKVMIGEEPAGPLVQLWLQELIDEKIGEGNTEII
jgi:hypothetical protein